MNYLDRVVEKWENESLLVIEPESEALVNSTYSFVGAKTAKDLIELYSKIGGMEEMDANFFRLWSLHEVKEEYSRGTPQSVENMAIQNFGVQFADCLVNSAVYRVKAIDTKFTHVYLDRFDSTEPTLLAESLHKFFERFYCDPNSIL